MQSFKDWFLTFITPKSARRQQEDEGQVQADRVRLDMRLNRFERLARTSVETSNEFAELVRELIEDSKKGGSHEKISKRPVKD